jgi:hypothetical protein
MNDSYNLILRQVGVGHRETGKLRAWKHPEAVPKQLLFQSPIQGMQESNAGIRSAQSGPPRRARSWNAFPSIDHISTMLPSTESCKTTTSRHNNGFKMSQSPITQHMKSPLDTEPQNPKTSRSALQAVISSKRWRSGWNRPCGRACAAACDPRRP